MWALKREYHPVVARLNAGRQARRPRVVIDAVVHVGQDGAPRFDAGNPVHRELAEISEEQHCPGADEGAGQRRLEKLVLEKL